MRTGVSMVGMCVAIAIGSSSVVFAGTPAASQPSSSSSRINAMMKKLDRFERRMDRQESSLYVGRERAGPHVAHVPDSRSGPLNR